MKCQHCGYEYNQNFNQCPACGKTTVQPSANYPYSQPYNYYNAQNPYYSYQPKKKSGGEKFAVVTAIILAVISPIAAFIIFLSFATYSTYDYVSDLPDYDYFYSSDYSQSQDSKYNFTHPTPKNTPVEFKEELFSFSNGYIETEYEVTLEETYRGDAAVKMLEGAKIPEINSMQEIYLVKFKVSITKQDTPAYVTLTSLSAYAYDSDNLSYPALSLIDYKDNTQLLMEGENGTRWMAFVVDKDDESPYIAWYDENKCEFFRNTEAAISDPSKVTVGEAVEEKISDDDTSSVE